VSGIVIDFLSGAVTLGFLVAATFSFVFGGARATGCSSRSPRPLRCWR
jgi:hypothetical protein